MTDFEMFALFVILNILDLIANIVLAIKLHNFKKSKSNS